MKKIEPSIFRGIMIHTQRHAKPTDLGMHIPPLKKGEIRVVGDRATAHTDREIDSICNDYIDVSRRCRHWGWFHDALKGRMDMHGTFHTLDHPYCPPEGDVVLKPAAERAKFTKDSLAEYKQRVRHYHETLELRMAEVNRANEESGLTALYDAWVAARRKANAIWDEIRFRAAHGSRADVQTIARHQRNLIEKEYPLSGAKSYHEFIIVMKALAQDIVWALAEGKRRRLPMGTAS